MPIYGTYCDAKPSTFSHYTNVNVEKCWQQTGIINFKYETTIRSEERYNKSRHIEIEISHYAIIRIYERIKSGYVEY